MTKSELKNKQSKDFSLENFPNIPEELIAQEPLLERDQSRLMILNRETGELNHKHFYDLVDSFESGDVLVMNNVKVFPARLVARKKTGGKVKVLLLKKFSQNNQKWTALLTPMLKDNTDLLFEGDLTGMVLHKRDSGEYEILFSRNIDGELDSMGKMPLPPYIRRKGESREKIDQNDFEYYQTIFARDQKSLARGQSELITPGAVAAPTAGLHFTEELIEKVKRKGVTVLFVCLHVGWGTFRPLQGNDYTQHQMLPEEYAISEETAKGINQARQKGGRVWAVGTTVVRTLEKAINSKGLIESGSHETDLFIYPGHTFKAVDVLVTNFHLKNHTPLLLAAAFAGTDFLEKSYKTAVQENYRFLSYGDAMLIV